MGKLFEVLRIVSTSATIILPIIMVCWNQFSKNARLQSWQVFIIGIIMIWLLIQVGVYFTNAYLQFELDAFDLDGNDVFTSEEINEAQRAAMMRVTSDTGRALAPITGVIYAMIYMSLVMMIAGLFNAFRKDKIIE